MREEGGGSRAAPKEARSPFDARLLVAPLRGASEAVLVV